MRLKLLLKPMTYAIFWLITLLWFFLLGFSLGQNEAPETVIPFLASIVPEQQEGMDTTIVPVTENELTYTTILQQASTPIVVPNDINVVEKDKKTSPLPSALETVKKVIQTVNPLEEAKYKFLVQLLAVKQKKSAEEYKDKLLENGITAELVEVAKNNISWYRVYTTFTGTVTQFNEFKDKLVSLGIVDTILREKTPQ